MLTGWQAINGKWYYFNNSGVMLTGWKLIDGKWYYFYGTGEMATNTTVDGYTLSASGAMV
jgi:glucan-binding YG repeat protein